MTPAGRQWQSVLDLSARPALRFRVGHDSERGCKKRLPLVLFVAVYHLWLGCASLSKWEADPLRRSCMPHPLTDFHTRHNSSPFRSKRPVEGIERAGALRGIDKPITPQRTPTC